MLHRIILILLVFLSFNTIGNAADKAIFEIETEGSYQMGAGSSRALAKMVAVFTARRKAVEVAARYLSRNDLVEAYQINRDEIYSLAAEEIQSQIIAEEREVTGATATYRVRIRARVQASDFIRAEMESNKQEEDESKESYKEKMEQPVSTEIKPGRDIAKAYRLLRQKKWRIAMIYLDHLEKKYPNWDSIYMAKAIAHYILHEPAFMETALQKGCRLGNQTACGDLKNIKKLQEHDFGLSVLE